MTRRFLALPLLLLAGSSLAQNVLAPPAPTGQWLTQDRGGVIAIAACGDHFCAHIAGVVLDHPDDAMPVDYKGSSQCGLALVTDAAPVAPNMWRGHILDPRNGHSFGVELRLKDADHLAVRGFLGISLLGRTEDWTRFTGAVPDDCRMAGAADPGQGKVSQGNGQP
jgi:uncharacterized protein (DUF2147 family)